jgi:hypothetical protein
LPDEKFNGEIVDALGGVLPISLLGFEHLVHQAIPDRQSDSVEKFSP